MYRILIFLFVILTTATEAQVFSGALTESSAQSTIASETQKILKIKNKDVAIQNFTLFFKNLGIQKESLFAELMKSKPENYKSKGSADYQALQKQYEILLDVYIAFDGLHTALTQGNISENCSKFELSYKMSVNSGSEKIKYTFYQTKVLELAKHLCQ